MSSISHTGEASRDLHALTEELARRIYGPGARCESLPGFEGGHAVWMEQISFDYASAVFAVTHAPFDHPEAQYFRLTGDVDVTDAWEDVEEAGETQEPPEEAPTGTLSIPDDLYVYWFDGLWYHMFALMSPNACEAFAAYHEWTPEDTLEQAQQAQRDGIVDGDSFTSEPATPPGGMPPSAWSKTGKRTGSADILGFA